MQRCSSLSRLLVAFRLTLTFDKKLAALACGTNRSLKRKTLEAVALRGFSTTKRKKNKHKTKQKQITVD